MSELLLKAFGKENIEELISLDLSNRNLPSLDITLLNCCSRLTSLNVSKNRIKTLSQINLPNLKELNFEENCISDLAFLSGVKAVEHLYCDGNPLNVADRCIAVDILQNLKTLDGKSCESQQNNVREFEERLMAQAELTLKSKFEARINSCTNLEEFWQYQKLFTREVLDKASTFFHVPPKFKRYKVQAYTELFIENTFSTLLTDLRTGTTDENSRLPCKKAKNNQPISPRKSPRKYLNKSTPSKDKKKSKISESSDSETEESSNQCEESDDIVSYEPQLFLRCHSKKDDPQDCTTAVWSAAFEPDPNDSGRTLENFATCGGNSVCFISCETGQVLKRCIVDSPDENLYAIDWTILKISGSILRESKTSVVATGGSGKTIYLIHPSQLKCYFSFKAHNKDINCLQFHPEERSLLFSGSKDGYIHLWDIGNLSLPDYKTSYNKLMIFAAERVVSQILVSSHHNCLLAATLDGMSMWDLSGSLKKWTMYSNLHLIVPKNFKSEESSLVDGIAFASRDIIACKVSRSGLILLWDVREILKLPEFSKPPKNNTSKKIDISPVVVFLWSECDSDYNSMSSCQQQVLCCGDNDGKLWVYGIKEYTKGRNQVSEAFELPTVVLPWPHLKFDNMTLESPKKIIINSVKFNWDAKYLVACTDSNFVCIWKSTKSIKKH